MGEGEGCGGEDLREGQVRRKRRGPAAAPSSTRHAQPSAREGHERTAGTARTPPRHQDIAAILDAVEATSPPGRPPPCRRGKSNKTAPSDRRGQPTGARRPARLARPGYTVRQARRCASRARSAHHQRRSRPCTRSYHGRKRSTSAQRRRPTRHGTHCPAVVSSVLDWVDFPGAQVVQSRERRRTSRAGTYGTELEPTWSRSYRTNFTRRIPLARASTTTRPEFDRLAQLMRGHPAGGVGELQSLRDRHEGCRCDSAASRSGIQSRTLTGSRGLDPLEQPSRGELARAANSDVGGGLARLDLPGVVALGPPAWSPPRRRSTRRQP